MVHGVIYLHHPEIGRAYKKRPITLSKPSSAITAVRGVSEDVDFGQGDVSFSRAEAVDFASRAFEGSSFADDEQAEASDSEGVGSSGGHSRVAGSSDGDSSDDVSSAVGSSDAKDSDFSVFISAIFGFFICFNLSCFSDLGSCICSYSSCCSNYNFRWSVY